MTRPREIAAHLAALPKLYGQAPPHALLAQVEAGAQALAARVSGWSPLLPKPADLAEAQRTATGLVQLLSQLRQYPVNYPHAPGESGNVATGQPGGNDAA